VKNNNLKTMYVIVAIPAVLLIASLIGNSNLRVLAQTNPNSNIPSTANHNILNNHLSPLLVSSGQPIQGPLLGTQTSP
jgi:hypothetical protein